MERNYKGPARVSGSAGTGKTIVALHRAVHLARKHADARVLLTTFSDTLAHALRTKLRRLIGNEPQLAERIDVHSLESLGLRLHRALIEPAKLIEHEELTTRVAAASDEVPDHKFSLHFLRTEWEQVVDAWQLDTWEAYRDVARLGRRTRLPEARRKTLWAIFERLRTGLDADGLTSLAAVFTRLAGVVAAGKHPPYDFAIVDEAQDLSVAQLRFFAALGGDRPNSLFFAGDLGQRIFQQPFSWKSLGVDIRGRSRTLGEGSTMHRAKGLEFRAVAVMACDDEVIPLQKRIESVGDAGDLQEVYDTERHLLYVACTRARDRLFVTSAGPASEFLDDLGT